MEKTVKERIAALREESFVKLNNAEALHDYLESLGDSAQQAELLALAVEPETLQQAFQLATLTIPATDDKPKKKRSKAKPVEDSFTHGGLPPEADDNHGVPPVQGE